MTLLARLTSYVHAAQHSVAATLTGVDTRHLWAVAQQIDLAAAKAFAHSYRYGISGGLSLLTGTVLALTNRHQIAKQHSRIDADTQGATPARAIQEQLAPTLICQEDEHPQFVPNTSPRELALLMTTLQDPTRGADGLSLKDQIDASAQYSQPAASVSNALRGLDQFLRSRRAAAHSHLNETKASLRHLLRTLQTTLDQETHPQAASLSRLIQEQIGTGEDQNGGVLSSITDGAALSAWILNLDTEFQEAMCSGIHAADITFDQREILATLTSIVDAESTYTQAGGLGQLRRDIQTWQQTVARRLSNTEVSADQMASITTACSLDPNRIDPKEIVDRMGAAIIALNQALKAQRSYVTGVLALGANPLPYSSASINHLLDLRRQIATSKEQAVGLMKAEGIRVRDALRARGATERELSTLNDAMEEVQPRHVDELMQISGTMGRGVAAAKRLMESRPSAIADRLAYRLNDADGLWGALHDLADDANALKGDVDIHRHLIRQQGRLLLLSDSRTDRIAHRLHVALESVQNALLLDQDEAQQRLACLTKGHHASVWLPLLLGTLACTLLCRIQYRTFRVSA